MSLRYEKYKARQQRREETERSFKRDNPDYRHSQGFKRESMPVQAWAKASARLAYVKAHRPIRQRGRVFLYSEDLPME